MDTIKRLGENETVRRITNGTLKSYVDREIDAVDTSAFINLETLNVPKAESVTIGEGVKDTLEVLNAPKAESIETYDEDVEDCVEGLNDLPNLKVADVHSADIDVPMFKGCTNLEKATVGGTKGIEPLVVNWGKCGGTEDVIVEYKGGEPLWIPKAFLNEPFKDGASPSDVINNVEVGYVKAEQNNKNLLIYRLPQELGKWLYENAEDCKTYDLYDGDATHANSRIYKGIAIYPDNTNSWVGSDNWGVGIRTISDLSVKGWASGTTTSTTSTPMSTEGLVEGAYYLVAQQNFTINASTHRWDGSGTTFLRLQLEEWSGVEADDSGADHIYLRHFNTMTKKPHWSNTSSWTQATDDPTNVGEKYACPMEFCIPTFNPSYFEGCNNLKEVVITNPELRVGDAIPSTVTLYADETKVPVEEQPLVVNWGRCGGTSDVIVTYNIGDPIWVPRGFLVRSFMASSLSYNDAKTNTPCDATNSVGLHCVLKTTSSGYNFVYKLPQNLGKWLYENAEDWNPTLCPKGDYNQSDGFLGSWERRNYKGIALYPDDISANPNQSQGYGVGIRKKSDIRVAGYQYSNNTLTPQSITYFDSDPDYLSLEDDAYYMMLENSIYLDRSSFAYHIYNSFNQNDLIYFRHWNTMTAPPYKKSSWNGTNDPTNMGAKYVIPVELCRPQKNVYYSKTKKAPMVVDWGKWGKRTFKVGEDSLTIPSEFFYSGFSSIDSGSYTLKASLTSKPSSDYVGYIGYDTFDSSRGLAVWKLPNNYGEYLYEHAESGVPEYWPAITGGWYKGLVYVPSSAYEASSVDGNYGCGFRKKSDINQRYNDGTTVTFSGGIFNNLMDEDSYYVVWDMGGSYGDKLFRQYITYRGEDWFLNRWIGATGPSSGYIKPSASLELKMEFSDLLPPLQITMAEYLKENNPNYDFRER